MADDYDDMPPLEDRVKPDTTDSQSAGDSAQIWTNSMDDQSNQVNGFGDPAQNAAGDFPSKENEEAKKESVSKEKSSKSLEKDDTVETLNKEEDDREEDMDILGNGLLKKKVIKPGLGRETRPINGDVVIINLVAKLDSGKQVEKEDSFKFTLGDHDVNQALDLCVALMEKGEISQLVTDSKYAFGDIGREPDIPPNARLNYTIEIIDSYEAPEYAELPLIERIESGDKKRERGNWLYARGSYGFAINSYSKALKILDDSAQSHSGDNTELQLFVDTKMKCYNNLAAAQLKLEIYDAALNSTEEVLKQQPENVKALFRKGKCLAGKGELSQAISCMRRALKLDPESKILHQEISKLVNKQKAAEKSEKAMYQRMMGDSSPGSKRSPPKAEYSKWFIYGGAITAAAVSAGIAAYKYSHV